MGMYDNLIINTDKLPVSNDEKKLIGENPNWQTRDFVCDLTEIYITDEGDLKINRWDLEEVPKEERPHPDGEGLLGLFGSMRRVNERLEVIPYHGYVNFYSTIGNDWYDFFAKFTDGKLVSIEVGKETKYKGRVYDESKKGAKWYDDMCWEHKL
jgi:hypothetical protein